MLVFKEYCEKSLHGESVSQVAKIVHSRENHKYRFEKCVNHSLKMKENPSKFIALRKMK